MFLIRRPSPAEINRFLEQSHELPLSYSPVGLAAKPPHGFNVDETMDTVGHGAADLARARAALDSWTHFDLGWVELFPPRASTQPGSVVALLIRHLGCWSLNGCRVVYTLPNGERPAGAGFAYGTLTNHAERGEEIFEVFLRPQSDEVVYRIRAVSQPRALLARAGYPFARVLQARFRRDSADAMRRATIAPRV
jgi:uncharacterized protein (UPF0548 family)